MRVFAVALALLSASSALDAAIPTPVRSITNPKSITSEPNAGAKAVPLADLGYTRGMLSAAWSADGTQLYLSTNLTGRYNIWRTQAGGSWPVQLTQGDDRQQGLLASPDGKTIYFNQDRGGNEQYDVYSVPAAGGPVTNLTNTPDIREAGVVMAPDGQRIALVYKPKARGQTDLAVLDLATGKVRTLTREADPQWDWTPVAWVDGGASLITNRSFTDQTASEVWKVDVATGKATRLLGKVKTVYSAADATADGETLSTTTNEGTGQSHAGVYSVRAGTFRWLKPTPWEQNADAIAPNGRSMVVSTGIDGRTELTLVDLATMTERPLQLPPGSTGVGSSKPFTPDSKKL